MCEFSKANVNYNHINAGDAKPVRQHPYRSYSMVRKGIQQVKNMLKSGIIESNYSMGQSPIELVKKK